MTLEIQDVRILKSKKTIWSLKKMAENWCWCNEHEKHQTDLLTNFGAKIQSLECSILSAIAWDGTTPFLSGLWFMKNSAKFPLYSVYLLHISYLFFKVDIFIFCTNFCNWFHCAPLFKKSLRSWGQKSLLGGLYFWN